MRNIRNFSLRDALLPKTRQGILATLLGQLEKTWYVSELTRRMGVPSSSLQRELQDLTRVGILKNHRQGHMAYYQANPAFAALSAYIDGCRIKRNASEYDFAGGVSDTDADGLLKTVQQFGIDAEAWVKTYHPKLA